jgi:hypothetical protein
VTFSLHLLPWRKELALFAVCAQVGTEASK